VLLGKRDQKNHFPEIETLFAGACAAAQHYAKTPPGRTHLPCKTIPLEVTRLSRSATLDPLSTSHLTHTDRQA